MERRRGRLSGTVQGIGFRPFVAGLARELGLAGRVANAPGEVVIEVEGPVGPLDAFAERVVRERPPAARISAASWERLAARGERGFAIAPSTGDGIAAVAIPPDLRMCPECRDEVADPRARRHRYPFTNCTRCGPRFTIADRAPWDRAATSMAGFAMCPACAREYDDPADRRWHAQPIACPACGPALALLDAAGRPLAARDEALAGAVEAIRRGRIVAVLGLGGFQLLADGTSEAAVRRLRTRKRREAKPFAVMVRDAAAARALVHLDAAGQDALESAAGPIVLAPRRAGARVAAAVAPGLARLGVMLPTTPLHALLADALHAPLVATSGNLHDAPIVIDPVAAVQCLGGIADAFLVHDRPVLRRADDSVVEVVLGRARTLRMGRGLAPATLDLPGARAPVVALGGHLKQAAAGARDGRAVLWAHVGDLDGPEARVAMASSVADLERFAAIDPVALACDAHPDYASTRFAQSRGLPLVPVHHHHAHVAAVLAEHGRTAGLGFAFDGAGLGPDGTTWGGECLAVGRAGARRVAHLRTFPLPGGDAAARDGWRCLAGMLHEGGIAPGVLGGSTAGRVARFAALAGRPALAPRSSSAGRLFDAVAALTGVCTRSRYEGEAAVRLEDLAVPGADPYPFRIRNGVVDWVPMLAAMVAGHDDAPRVASRLHATLAAMVDAMTRRESVREVVLSGGCFRNRVLAEGCAARLHERGISVLLPERVPAGDGGLALGQLRVAAWQLEGQR